METVLVHYASEIHLKGKNRRDFENQLVRNIKNMLGKSLIKADKQFGRILLTVKNKKAIVKLKKVFGISWFAVVEDCKSDLTEIKKTCSKLKVKGKTFKVKVKRADKKFPVKSQELNKILGEIIYEKNKAEVDIKNPEVIVNVEITEKGTFIFSEKFPGTGGLPVGTGGKVLVMMSGGIDSPVAAHQMMKRGCVVDYLHFHALRFDKDVKDTKIPKLVTQLKDYDPNSKLFLVSHNNFDLASQAAPSEYHLILFRRYMFRAAQELAKKIGAKAIVTGDNLAQVASQTLDNLSVVDAAMEVPVFRPVLTYDKQDIVDLAKEIGTYEESIKPYKDCCAIISKKPKTKAKLDRVEKYEKLIGQDKLVKETVNKF